MRADATPLSTLLSRTLIAFTIEFDNEWERQFADSRIGRILPTSLVMWANYLRFVRDDGLPVREFGALAGVSAESIRSRVGAFERWGYLIVDRPPGAPRKGGDWAVRPTAKGRLARAIWQPLGAEIERRWTSRFGAVDVTELRSALHGLIRGLDLELPRYVPILGHGLASPVRPYPPRVMPAGANDAEPALELYALLAQVLIVYTLEFESESTLSLALGANVLRVLGEAGARVRDLPELTGVSKEAIAMALGFLEKRGLATIEPGPDAARTKVVQLTQSGLAARAAYRRRLDVTEERLTARFGQAEIARLRALLRGIAERRVGDKFVLAQGLQPPPGGWRGRKPYLTQTLAVLRDPTAALPHYPMVLHRGGWPDGS